jgi:hypothetical protein
MDSTDRRLWIFLVVGLLLGITALLMESKICQGDSAIHPVGPAIHPVEPFQDAPGTIAGISIADLSTRALDASPTTSEVKGHYKNLLVFADADIRKQGTKGLRILADFRDRVYGDRDFRADLTVDDFLANWPAWLPPLDPTMQEPVPTAETAVTSEARILAYLQKNFPQEDNVDQDTGSTIRNIIEDFGQRFVFESDETVALRPDFLAQPLLQNWRNPAASR